MTGGAGIRERIARLFRDVSGRRTRIRVPHLETHLTHRCNLTCEGCLHFSNHGHSGDVAPEELKRSMALWNGRLVPQMFRLLGGEPTLHRDLVEIVYMTREMWPDSRTRIELNTNGLLLHLHPDLPRALADTRTALYISIHSDDAAAGKYQEKLARSLELAEEWQRQYGIEVQADLQVPWERGHKGYGGGMMPFEDGDPDKSWDNCVTGQTCFQLFEDCLWKCAPLAYLKLQDRKFSLPAIWRPYLQYQPLQPGCTDGEIVEFFGRKSESVCGMCPSNPASFTKKDPMLPLRYYTATSGAVLPEGAGQERESAPDRPAAPSGTA